MKLNILSPDTAEACFIYRGQPWTQLGIETQCYSGKTGFQLWHSVLTADVVLMCRPYTKQQVSIATTIKDAGKKLIIDWDDSYTDLPPWNPNAHHFQGCEPTLNDLCRLADVVTVSTEALRARATLWGAKKAVIVPNAIDDSLGNIYRAPRRSKAVLWRGSSTHSADLEEGKAYFLEMANSGYEIIFFGDKPSWAYQVPRHRHFGVSDYANFLTTMAKLAPEYVAVPLVNHPFNIAKSDIAAQEAFLIGAKLWHNGVGEFAQHKLNAIGSVRWLSAVQPIRKEIICSLQ